MLKRRSTTRIAPFIKKGKKDVSTQTEWPKLEPLTNERLALALEVVAREVGYNYAGVKLYQEKVVYLAYETMRARKEKLKAQEKAKELAEKLKRAEEFIRIYNLDSIMKYVLILESKVEQQLKQENEKYH